METMARSILLAFGAFFLITTCVGLSLAQTSRGVVSGTVTDQTGAVISGADVELKKLATNEVRTTRTNDSGIYRFDAVDLGVYDVILKATKVDGVYDSDPKKNPKAKKYPRVTYIDALQQQLKVMDSTAFSLCMDNEMPIIVFNMREAGNIRRVVLGEAGVGTKVG